jgi:hypothetical protein
MRGMKPSGIPQLARPSPIRASDDAAPEIGSITAGSLFLTLPTRALTGQQVISSDGEDELDFADIGRETGAATHGASIAASERGGQSGWPMRPSQSLLRTLRDRSGRRLRST